MEGPGERLCVGEPERLSLDDWWNPEEKLRLLCMGGGGVCLDSFFKMLRRLLQKKKMGVRSVFSLKYRIVRHSPEEKEATPTN